MSPASLALVALGGALGSTARHLMGLLALRLFGSGFPYGTLIVNILGGLMMGAFVELLALKLSGSTALRLFFATGVLGGFTTFSSFALDFAVLFERNAMGLAAVYLATSVAGSILALFAGLWLVRSLV